MILFSLLPPNHYSIMWGQYRHTKINVIWFSFILPIVWKKLCLVIYSASNQNSNFISNPILCLLDFQLGKYPFLLVKLPELTSMWMSSDEYRLSSKQLRSIHIHNHKKYSQLGHKWLLLMLFMSASALSLKSDFLLNIFD